MSVGLDECVIIGLDTIISISRDCRIKSGNDTLSSAMTNGDLFVLTANESGSSGFALVLYNWANHARGGMWHIGNGAIPFATLPGVFTSIATLIFIAWVAFFGKIGFITSLTIITLRLIRLGGNLVHHNLMILPGIFITFVALVAVVIIYYSNRRTIKTERKYRRELEEFNKSIIGAFTNCIDGKDAYTNGHSYRVAQYTVMLGKKLGLDEETLDKYYNIGLLHDIGKISIPDAILTKPGKLFPEVAEALLELYKEGALDYLRE